MQLSKLVYQVGVRLRNRKIIDNFAFLRESQRWDIRQIQGYQLAQLKGLLQHAYDNSAYYRTKLTECGVRPDNVVSFSDLARVPVLTKDELLAHAQAIQNAVPAEKMFYSETSGSTGKPLVFYRNADWDAWHRASVLRGYSWYGVAPWERNGYFWGYNLSLKRRLKTRFLDLLQNRFRMFSYDQTEIDSFVEKLEGASYLEGYSSMIYEVAKRINQGSDKPLFHLKMIKGTSEKIFERYQLEVQKAFGKKIISEYGAAEAGIIAFECPAGSMHLNMETAIVEDENNEIIVTNLVSKSFPVIRYKLGDYVEIDRTSTCPCGMQHYIVREILGRVGKVIYGAVKQYPSLTLYYVFKNLAMEHDLILNYQAVQTVKGQMELNIEEKLGPQQKNLLVAEVRKYYKDDLAVYIQDQVDLKSSSRKRVDFVSQLQ